MFENQNLQKLVRVREGRGGGVVEGWTAGKSSINQ